MRRGAAALASLLLLLGCTDGNNDVSTPEESNPSSTATGPDDAAGGTPASTCSEAEREVIATSADDEFTPTVTTISDGGLALEDGGAPLVADTVYAEYAQGTLAFDDLPQPVARVGSGDAPRFVVYCTGEAAGRSQDGTPFSGETIIYGVTAGTDGTLALVFSFVGDEAGAE